MRRKGFTLLELVVVMAIIAILATVAMPTLGRYVAHVRLQFAGLALVQDVRDMQADAIGAEDYYTIVFKTSENRYYYRQGTKSSAPAGMIPTERSLDQSAGFPLAVGKGFPVSAVFGSETSLQNSLVTMSFNSAGRPAQTGGGRVTLVDRMGDQLDVIVTSVDGSARMEWVH